MGLEDPEKTLKLLKKFKNFPKFNKLTVEIHSVLLLINLEKFILGDKIMLDSLAKVMLIFKQNPFLFLI